MSIARFGQNMFDVVIREAGRLEAIFELALYNQLAVDDSLYPGTVLETQYTNKNESVKNYFQTTGRIPNNWHKIDKAYATVRGDVWSTEDGEVWEWQ